MKKIVEKIIRLRNPYFKIDERISIRILILFSMQQMFLMLRSARLLLYWRLPKKMLLKRGVTFFNLSGIKYGSYLKLGEFVHLSALGYGKIVLGNKVNIGAFSRVIISTTLNELGSHIHIGNNVAIGEYAYLGGAGGLNIDDDCIIGQYFSCHPENHNYQDIDTPIRLQGVSRKGISIGKNCWIGSKVTILDGVSIGDGCVIAAGAVVTKSCPDNCIIGGVPAKILKERCSAADKLLKEQRA